MEEQLYDHLEIRCPKLGGEVTFAYCQKEGGDLPCHRTIACWQPYFPVETYLRSKLTETAWDRCFDRQPKEKMLTLIELIEAAKNRTQAEE
ncbi:MAG: hypothetical protein JSU72_16770 [Deltaproteobacteria bacterium]|nr:MAG: hypothetical protein JSU72_16770 [Deltaproteobacteria bacterium]